MPPCIRRLQMQKRNWLKMTMYNNHMTIIIYNILYLDPMILKMLMSCFATVLSKNCYLPPTQRLTQPIPTLNTVWLSMPPKALTERLRFSASPGMWVNIGEDQRGMNNSSFSIYIYIYIIISSYLENIASNVEFGSWTINLRPRPWISCDDVPPLYHIVEGRFAKLWVQRYRSWAKQVVPNEF